MDEVNLATAIASEHFGKAVASVVRMLLVHPLSSIRDITTSVVQDDTLVNHRTVQNALAILLQHNIAERHTRNGMSEVLYTVDAKRIMLRCRFPEFIRVAASEYNDIGASITKLFFERGCLTARDLITLLKSTNISSSHSTDDIEDVLLDMVKDGFLRMAGRINKSESGRSRSLLHGEDDLPHKRRKEENSSDCDRCDHDVVLNDTSWNDIDWVYVGADEKGEHREKVSRPRANDATTVWRVSFWYLIRFMRLSVCANVVKAQLRDPSAVKVISAAMRYALSIEDQRAPTDDYSTPLLDTRKVKAYMDEMLDQESTMDVATFMEKVREMASGYYGYLSYDKKAEGDTPNSFRVEIAHLVCLVREQTVDNIISMKSGKYGKRIFRSLVRCGNLEEKSVADKAMMPLNTACAELYKLYGMNLIYRREVPKSSEVRAQNCYYLWGVNMKRVQNQVITELYQTTYNLLAVLQQLKNTVGSSKSKLALKGHNRQLDLLELHILRTDHAIMLFRDLGPYENTVRRKPD